MRKDVSALARYIVLSSKKEADKTPAEAGASITSSAMNMTGKPAVLSRSYKHLAR